MSRKIAYVVDSTLINSLEDLEGTDIFMQPLDVVINGEVKQDIVELPVDEFYEAFKKGAVCSTSQPSIGKFAELYEKIRDLGYTDIIAYTLTSGLSGTYNSAIRAAEIVDGINIRVVDTQIITVVVLEIVKHMIEVAKERELSVDEIVEQSLAIIETAEIHVYIGDLEPLKKGGRLSGAAAFVGKMLQIKPIIKVDEGIIKVVGKERTEKKAISKIAELAAEGSPTNALLLQTPNRALAESLAAAYEKTGKALPLPAYNLTAVIGVHAGIDATGIVTWSM